MREIKFRAWQRLFKEMIPVFSIDIENQIINTNGPWRFLSEVELMQYTGLKDKNGVEIYEGDILTSEEYPYQDEGVYNYHGIVEYAEEIAAFVVVKRVVNQKKRGISDGMADYFEEIPFEVIGNIYENPELLEGAE